MSFAPLKIAGAWLHTPTVFPDERGNFHEVFKASELEAALGRTFPVLQVNQSVSKKGVVRGIHWTDSDLGQAKYVSCIKGAIWDFVVDLRLDSPTFGVWDGVFLSTENKCSALISEGIGHGFLALEDESAVRYMCSSEYDPANEKVINPLDPVLQIPLEEVAKNFAIEKLILNEKDASAPSLSIRKL